MASHNSLSSADAPVAIKITIAGKDDCRKFRLSLKDLSPTVLPNKVCRLTLPFALDAVPLCPTYFLLPPLEEHTLTNE